ncbi:MAG: hypothetical protein RKP20_06005 [Candidatus Competibacter sp.]|nr:hypothetical protein [Candidatus Competibacter sp.]
MNLSRREIERFYGIWLPLLHYVNAQRQLVAHVPLVLGAETISPQDVGRLRQALWENDALRKAFIADNPAGLSDTDLEMVASWDYRVAGRFYILRYLKKHAVFLTEREPPQAYGVLGLVSPIQEVVPMSPPVLVDAVLLPFEDRIIYDSLLMPYRVMFGAGIRRSLNEAYHRVQERGGVTTTLQLLGAEATQHAIGGGNQKVLAAFRKELLASGLSPKMVEEHTGNIAGFVDTYWSTPKQPRPLLELDADGLQQYLRQQGKNANWVSFRRLVRFLRDTNRIDWDRAEAMQRLLKQR